MADDDDVVKNPARNNARQQTPYEPEYIRLNKKVMVKDHNGQTTGLSSNPHLENSVVGLDGDIDGGPVNMQGHIIDNNDYVDFGHLTSHAGAGAHAREKKEENLPAPENQENISPGVGEYILMVLGKFVLSGFQKEIEDKVKSIMYGLDKEFSNQEIRLNDIVVLKRVKLKMGIFFDD